MQQRGKYKRVKQTDVRHKPKQYQTKPKMLKLTPTKRVLFVRSLRLWLLVLVGVFSFALAYARIGGTVSADTSNTINFQARLQTSAGAIVPDGDYNVEFKLYDASSCNAGVGCTALWSEDYLNSAGTGLETVNGYFSTALGSITSFPTTIDWSQKLWLTMNIGGTTTTVQTLVWDGEMSPRLQLTAVPYAFQADHASKADQLTNTANGNTSVLSFAGSAAGHGNQTFVLPDKGAAGTYNLVTQDELTGLGLGGSDAYVSLQTGTVSVQAGALGVQTALISSDNSTAFKVQSSEGTSVLSVDSTTSTVNVANLATTGTVTMASATISSDLTVSGTAYLANVSISGDVTVAGAVTYGTQLKSSCQGLTNYIWVPGSAKYGTLPGFCVMKYEAKDDGSGNAVTQASGTPWVSINQDSANVKSAAACSNGCHLISNAEWMTIAENAYWQPANWTGGAVGSGKMYIGHSDDAPDSALAASSSDTDGYYGETNTGGDQRRTLWISQGNGLCVNNGTAANNNCAAIWDFSGNVWDWTSSIYMSANSPDDGTTRNGVWIELNTVLHDNGFGYQYLPPNSSYTTTQGLGALYSMSANSLNVGMIRGGSYLEGANDGAFALSGLSPRTATSAQVGFRVAR